MLWETPPSADQTSAMLDYAPLAIYVSALDSYELLYANRVARELFLREPSIEHMTCYQAAGFDRPCPFCRVESLSRDGLLVREYRQPLTGRIYQLSGKIISWDGIPAHIEYIWDITEKKRDEDRSEALKQELQATFSSVPCGLCVYQYRDGRISPLFHNPAFYEIMGYSDEHIRVLEVQTNFLGVHPEDLDRLKEIIRDAVASNGVLQHTYRLYNDREGDYRWIRLDGSVKSQEDGTKLLYGVYSDVSEEQRLKQELTDANDKMQDIVNAIPGGVAIYKVSDIFETVYFSDGVPALSGYTPQEYRELMKQDAADMTYWEDTAMVVAQARRVIETHEILNFEFRKQHRDGNIVWVRVQVKWIGEEDGCPLLHCVFHNITDLKEAHLEMEHLVNSIPGGIASYRVEGERFIPTFYSDGVAALSGHTREEFDALVGQDVMSIVYDPDRNRVLAAAETAIKTGAVLDVSYRIRHKDGSLIWVHLNGRRMGPLSDATRFYAVFTGMSAETRLFQSIANETADGIYVIDKENYDLLYVNESKHLFVSDAVCAGQKCYEALQGKKSPCEFCTLKTHPADGAEHEMPVEETDHFYTTRFRETDWNGIPAYVKYIRDVTEEVNTRREKERLEQYFQTVVQNLPGGIAVVRFEEDGRLTPEYLSDGFAAMTGMTLEQAWELYQTDAMAGVHPDDRAAVNEHMASYVASGDSHCEIVYRLLKGDGSYVWVKNTLSLIQDKGVGNRVYAVYHDMTKEREEQELVRKQYNDLIVQHYRTPGANALVVGHCNITRNRILEIIDYTGSDLLRSFGTVREEFFTSMGYLVVDPDERQAFWNTYLNKPSLEAFRHNDTEHVMDCFIRLPQEPRGRYARFKMNLVSTPDSGDVTGILTVTDITEQTVSERIMHQLSVASYDLVVDVDLPKDRYTVLTCDTFAGDVPEQQGCHSDRIAHMLQNQVVPKDQKRTAQMLDVDYMLDRLKREGSYTFSYSIAGEKGDILTKNLTASAVDLRLGRVCLARADITASIREQQGLLNMIAYTFELAGFININTGQLTLHTRQTVLENLPPFTVEDYRASVDRLSDYYKLDEGRAEIERQFKLDTMLRQLKEKPAGYEFVFSCRPDNELRYKQVNVLWGDENHRTICLVRADVTDMLASERETKRALEKALSLAKEANQAKSDFLSAMSHDIRTPMNAIIGMTTLAIAHLDDRDRVADCLNKVSVSSKHLLSLINDVLDMSKIGQSQMTFNRILLSLPELLDQLSAIMKLQAEADSVQLLIHAEGIRHEAFYGDALRINQILINLLSNAVKFTPAGGRVEFLAEELTPPQSNGRVRYRFTVSDTGIGMSEDFMTHLFEPFTRGSRAQQIEGTGLGLSIVKGLVDLMDGTISVESRPNQGTTFRVELEFDAAQKEESSEKAALESPFSFAVSEKLFAGRRFLIAEDNLINAEILCDLLAMYGAKSVVTENGALAVQAFQKAEPGTYDAVLMDIQMPEMNGYEATRAIRELDRRDAAKIPIIAMTANAFAEDVRASLDAGMNAHIAKPIEIDVLQTTLIKALESEDAANSINPASN